MRHTVIVCCLTLSVAACGGNGSPTEPTPTPTPTPTTYALSGTVSDARNGGPLGGATVRITDGPDAGKTTGTNGSGQYRFAALQRAGFTASASKQYYDAHGEGVDLTQDRVVDFRLRYIEPWSKSGTGDNVFDMPRIARVKITGDYAHCCSNFIVHIAGEHVVNELIGTAYDSTHFEGTYLTSGGTVEILSSSGVRWTFTEVR